MTARIFYPTPITMTLLYPSSTSSSLPAMSHFWKQTSPRTHTTTTMLFRLSHLVVVALVFVVSLSQVVPVAVAAFFVHNHVTTIISSSTSSLQATRAAAAAAAAAAVTNNSGGGGGITERDVAIQQLLQRARALGPIGTDCTRAEQEELVTQARAVAQYSDPQPARVPLQPNSVHDLIYSASPGGSSGKIFGPLIIGKVTQTIVDERHMINAVEWGPLRIALNLHRQVLDNVTTRVTFEKTTTFLFGMTVAERPMENQSGIWNIHFVGEVVDVLDGQRKLVRVMETPNLFILVSGPL